MFLLWIASYQLYLSLNVLYISSNELNIVVSLLQIGVIHKFKFANLCLQSEICNGNLADK